MDRSIAKPDRRHAVLRMAVLVAIVLATCIALFALAEALFPDAIGKKTYKSSGLVVEASQLDQGYIMAKYKKSNKKLKLRVTKGSDVYTYDLNQDGEYETFPLQLGNGKYKVQLYRQTSGNKYSSVASVSFKATLADENLPYLYPNQYCWYVSDSDAVALAEQLCKDAGSDAKKVELVYEYVTKNMIYDYIRALTVKSGYLPNVDRVLADKRGICFDFAALMACLLRTQGVPTQLVIGYADEQYHAWNNVLVDGSWLRYDATSAVTMNKVKQYTTERIY